jgi:hypothetical protein
VKPLRLSHAEIALDPPRYLEAKDPCPVRDGERWHLFGTGIPAPDRFEVLHATSASLEGPWRQEAVPVLPCLRGSCLAAPGVVREGSRFHMFLQTDFDLFGGRIEHLVSDDDALSFRHAGTALASLPGSDEAGIYDAHPAHIDGERYLTYSAFQEIGAPDIHLARSLGEGWDGPWERLGPILTHGQVPFHNVRGAPDYEWGLEGGHLLELTDGHVLLTAVCFLPLGSAGSRQRVFLAIANDACGPFRALGPIAPRAEGSGENGHAVTVLDGEGLAVMLQERNGADGRWGYAVSRMSAAALDSLSEPVSA